MLLVSNLQEKNHKQKQASPVGWDAEKGIDPQLTQ
ncbi:hypothetical protein GA0116948_103206 [Chitinophaga costaii]|uniref:Uncharacterized protein n=1 Tax=Chitinophaga costaii TaxID=1335309 RepID=A0A1C4BQ71_9BACT|nr:hypothetical protein GA0116948_103206 [Chitinophaga costaii]